MNENRAYRPLFKNSGNVIGFVSETAPDLVAEGLYFRDNPGAVQEALGHYLEGKRPMKELPLDLAQSWIDIAWKTPHATDASLERFGAKAREEMAEIDEAFKIFTTTQTEEARRDTISELGDVLFVATALASNAGCRVAAASSARAGDMMDYCRAHTETQPAWWHAAAAVQQNFSGPSLGELQNVIDEGFVSHSLAQIDAAFSKTRLLETADEALRELQQRVAWLVTSAHMQRPEAGCDLMASTAFVELTRKDISPAIADIWSLAAYIAHHHLDSNLSEVMSMTMRKVNDRVASGTIDKTDGGRSPGQ